MKSKMKKTTLGLGSVHQAQVEKLVYGGDGLCRVNGKVVFIPFCLADEGVEFEIIREKKDVAFGRMLRVLSPNPKRISPRCKVFGICGGCHLQHMSYEDQVSLKSSWVKESLSPFSNPKTIWQDARLSTSPWEYRRRIRLHRSTDGRWGFFRRREHEVVEIDSCPVAHPALMVESKNFPVQTPELDLIYDSQKKRVLAGMADGQLIEDTLQGFQIEIEAGDFLQVNEEENQKLVGEVQALTESSRGGVLWDLFSGSGNFSIPLAKHFSSVLSVESNARAMSRLKKNCERNSIINITTHTHRVTGEFIREIFLQNPPDCILLDPPRGGAMEVAKTLVDLNYQGKMVYVSCDLASLRRDMAIFNAAGATLEEIKWFDLFPQTFHLETVVLLDFGKKT